MGDYYDTQPGDWFVKRKLTTRSTLTLGPGDLHQARFKQQAVIQATLPGIIILGAQNPYLEAALELQLRQDEIKQDYHSAIMALVRRAVSS